MIQNIIKFTLALFIYSAFTQQSFADEISISNPEGAAIRGSSVLVISLGKDDDFGNQDKDGAIFEIDFTGKVTQLPIGANVGLKNPTSILPMAEDLVIVDGNALIRIDSAGKLVWREELKEEGAFLYDVAQKADGQLLITNFGNGRLYKADPKSGKISKIDELEVIPGLARIAVGDNSIYATTWGSGDKFDGRVVELVSTQGKWSVNQIVSGFGNSEGIQLDSQNKLVVAAWRGHEKFTDGRVFNVNLQAEQGKNIQPLVQFDKMNGPADFVLLDNKIVVPVLRDNLVKILSIKNNSTE